MQEHQQEFSIDRMSEVLSVSRSGYYAWSKHKPSKRQQSNDLLDKKVTSIFTVHQGRYGVPRITIELQAQGEVCSKNRVARRMRFLSLHAKAKKKFKVTTDSNHKLAVAPNLLCRDFGADTINQKWVSDISYVWTEEGWMYLAIILDLYSRAVIGWSIQSRMTKVLVCNALNMALWKRQFPRQVIVHSDQGSQYCSHMYQKLLKSQGLLCSMSRRGNCWDNSVAESFFHTIKTELIYEKRYLSRDAAKQSIFEYIEIYYNKVRRHSAIGFEAPYNFENQSLMSHNGVSTNSG